MFAKRVIVAIVVEITTAIGVPSSVLIFRGYFLTDAILIIQFNVVSPDGCP
jgi:hypothetical protein